MGDSFWLYGLLLVLVSYSAGLYTAPMVPIGGDASAGQENVTGVEGYPVSEVSELYYVQPQDERLERHIGLYVPSIDESVLCTVDWRDGVKISEQAFKYVNSTRCSVLDGDLSGFDNQSFENKVPYERLMNRTKG